MNKRFKIAGWIVDPNQCLLERSPKNLKLEPKAMALLVVLAEANGELVSRQQIFDLIWPNQHVTDYALNTLISNLRKTLGTSTEGKNLIETRPKLGYRLDTNIEWLTPRTVEKKNFKTTFNNRLIASFISIAFLAFIGFNFFSKETSDISEPMDIDKSAHRYLIKVNLNYTFSEKDEFGTSYCENYSYEIMSRAIYKGKKWKIQSQHFTYDLNHTGKTLANIKEKHLLEYKHQLGKEIDEMEIRVDEVGLLTGHAKMKVLDNDDNLLCEGMSIFIGEKFESA